VSHDDDDDVANPGAPVPDASRTLAPGEVVAKRYRVVRPLRRGGMGEVFEAVHVLTGRRLAIKVLLPAYAHDAEAVARFTNEARATAAVGDPHVLEVVDLGRLKRGDRRATVELYIAFELLEGDALADAIARAGAMPVGRAAHIAAQLAATMGRAHARGIVHRDLTPANVFLVARDGDPDYVKVLDFGVAKLLPAAGGEVPGLTRSGQVLGTPAYMPPEQLLSGARDVDAPADVYAIGAMLYEMLAGGPVWPADSASVQYHAVLTTDPPPLATRRAGVPPALAAIVHRALAREVGERFASGDELARALAPFAGVARVPPLRWKSVAAAIVLLLGAAGAVVLWKLLAGR
jgi:serine/threonine protein kinase